MTLKHHLEATTSPLRQALKEHLSRLTPTMRTRWKAAVAGVEPTIAPEGQPAGLLGHAISERLVWSRSALASPGGALAGASRFLLAGGSRSVISELQLLTEVAAPDNTEETSRAAVLVGLLDLAYRYAPAVDEPWFEPFLTTKELSYALASVPKVWVDDVVAVTERSAPLLGAVPGKVTAAPSFSGSPAVGGADADLILGSTLVEIKSSGSPVLSQRDYQQLVTYALLDFDDSYDLARVALLSARYGRMVTWDLEELLDQAGGATLYEMRSLIKETLGHPG